LEKWDDLATQTQLAAVTFRGDMCFLFLMGSTLYLLVSVICFVPEGILVLGLSQNSQYLPRTYLAKYYSKYFTCFASLIKGQESSLVNSSSLLHTLCL
jgi:uncharacterized metal-binding protein